MHDSIFTTSSIKENGNMNDDLQHSNLKGKTQVGINPYLTELVETPQIWCPRVGLDA